MALLPDPWLPLEDVRVTPSGRLETHVRLDPSSEWFSGHFEDCPLVPGVAILAFAVEAVRSQGRREGRNLEVAGFSRVRFKKFVHPDEKMHIAVDPMPLQPEAALQFHITIDGNDVAQGLVKVKETGDPVLPEK
jgi:3-hydroxymyristoyl/3-hydroxydecanoyl-(acyl carrier protein) dehydratase